VRRVVAVVFAAALVFPAAASAHARLLFSSPADGEVLRAPPTAAVLRFDDSVAVGPGNAAVNASGASILGGVPRAHGHVLTIPLSARGNGSFTVRWSVVSDDGHDVSGVIAFAVGSAAVPHATLSARGNGPSALDVLERWLLVGGILLAAGASVFGAAVARLRRVAVLAAAGFVVAGAGALLEWSRVPDSTRFGHAMLVVAVSAAVGAGLAVLAAWRSTFVWAPLPAAAVALVAASLGGHVLDAGVSRLEVGVDVAHFAAAAVWIGGLASLVVALPHADSRVAARFSRLALASVALVAVTGVLRALSELSSVGQVFSTSYGRALIAKSALFVALIGIGYANRSRFLTRRHLLRRSGAAELVVAGILVVAIAVLTSVAPGRVLAAQHESAARETGSGPPPVPPGRALTIAGQLGSRGVALSVTPAGTKLASRVTVLGSSGDGVDGRSRALDDAMWIRLLRHVDPGGRLSPRCRRPPLPLLCIAAETVSQRPRHAASDRVAVPRGEDHLLRRASLVRPGTDRHVDVAPPGAFEFVVRRVRWKLRRDHRQPPLGQAGEWAVAAIAAGSPGRAAAAAVDSSTGERRPPLAGDDRGQSSGAHRLPRPLDAGVVRGDRRRTHARADAPRHGRARALHA
jgi:copper transport protein